MSYRISGDPTRALGGGPAEDAEGEEEKEDSTYREIHHLAFMVWQVDNNTSVVPSGAFVFDASGQLVPNPAFSGLDRVQGSTLSAYLHLRKPQGRAELWRTKQGMVDASKVLDPVGGQRAPPVGSCPVGAWAILKDAAGTGVTIRSNEFPGTYGA